MHTNKGGRKVKSGERLRKVLRRNEDHAVQDENGVG